MSLNGWNLVILLGALHGLMLSALLLFSRRNNRYGNALLALVLFFYTLPVLRIILIDIGFFEVYGVWFLSVEFLYGLGPSLYLYARTVTDPTDEPSWSDGLHFIPMVLEFIYYISPIYGAADFRLALPIDSPAHFLWVVQQSGGLVSVLIYLALTNRLLWRYTAWLRNNYSDIGQRTLDWLRRPIVLYSVFFVVWLCLRIVDVVHFDDTLGNAPYYPLLVFLSLSTYWIGTRGYLETQLDVQGFSRTRERRGGDDEAVNAVYNALTDAMQRDRLYLKNDLTLAALAEKLGVNPRLLSQAINDVGKTNFYDFIARYRVAAIKERLGQGDTHIRLIDLALECGFNSKATFNHVFKKQTGVTPSEYRRTLFSGD